MASRTLLKGGCVLTLGARTPNFTEADVLIEGGVIVEVGPGIRARQAEMVDATDTIVMPGFVDTHRHVSRSLFRNSGGPGPQTIRADHYSPDDVYAATLIGLLGAVEAGITTVVDWADASQSPEHLDAALAAHRDSGLRTVFVHKSSLGQRVDDSDTTSFAFASDDLTDTDELADEWESARRSELRIHAHAGLPDSPEGVVADLGRSGLLGEDVTLAHCSHLGRDDLDAISSSGTGVSLTPASEMTGGLGSPPIQDLIERAIRPGLGVDDEQVAPGDMFAQMRAVISIQHAESFDLKLAGKGGVPNLLTTREVIRYGTTDGATAVGLAHRTGSLEPGKRADIIVLRTDRPNISPVNDPIGAVVWGMDTSNLDWVFVEGEPLVAHGDLQADIGEARTLALAAQRRVGERAGVITAGELHS